jgi:sulfur-carrier protein
MQLNLFYFASLREALGMRSEVVQTPDSINNVAQLIAWMRTRPAPFDEAFAANMAIRCAVNQVVASDDIAIATGFEIAFFPPVTGG